MWISLRIINDNQNYRQEFLDFTVENSKELILPHQ